MHVAHAGDGMIINMVKNTVQFSVETCTMTCFERCSVKDIEGEDQLLPLVLVHDGIISASRNDLLASQLSMSWPKRT